MLQINTRHDATFCNEPFWNFHEKIANFIVVHGNEIGNYNRHREDKKWHRCQQPSNQTFFINPFSANVPLM